MGVEDRWPCVEHAKEIAMLSAVVKDLKDELKSFKYELHKDPYGNGQPGHIQRLDNRITGVRDAFSIKQWLPLVLMILMCISGWIGTSIALRRQ